MRCVNQIASEQVNSQKHALQNRYHQEKQELRLALPGFLKQKGLTETQIDNLGLDSFWNVQPDVASIAKTPAVTQAASLPPPMKKRRMEKRSGTKRIYGREKFNQMATPEEKLNFIVLSADPVTAEASSLASFTALVMVLSFAAWTMYLAYKELQPNRVACTALRIKDCLVMGSLALGLAPFSNKSCKKSGRQF